MRIQSTRRAVGLRAAAALAIAALAGVTAASSHANSHAPGVRVGQHATHASALGGSTLGPARSISAASPMAMDSDLDEIDSALAGWDLPSAEAAIDSDDNSIETQVKRGVLAVYEARYAEAEQLLAAAVATEKLTPGSAADEEARHYLALARGAQRALGDTPFIIDNDEATVRAVFAAEKDAIIAPYLFAAMENARTVMGEVIGIEPDHPIRFEFLDDPAKLAMVTPLTVDNIRTTGTVGVTKYRRIMMITPRVMLYGYGWIDTAVHEYVHYVLTIRTGNQAPVWLQEGLAKLLETRWRRSTPDPLEPGVAYRLHQAIVRDDLVTFSEMYPSVAMLPSAERAALAYAEVETMLGLLYERKGSAGLAVLLDAVADGEDAEDALARAWGGNFDSFMDEWKRVTKKRTARSEEGGELPGIVFKDDASDIPPERLGDVFSHLGGGKARQHARLGTLLQARGHDRAAAIEYERARKADSRARKDPALSKRLGKLYVALDEFDKAAPLLDIAAAKEPEDANLAAAQGRAHLRSGDAAGAHDPLDRAIRNNPFIPTLHCDLAILAVGDDDRDREAAQCPE
jgi:tetratricopeptide (TPR) repeat protein